DLRALRSFPTRRSSDLSEGVAIACALRVRLRVERCDARVVKTCDPAFGSVHLVTVDAAADPAAVASHRFLGEARDLGNLGGDAIHRSRIPRTAHEISEVISSGVFLDISQGFARNLFAVALHFRSRKGW